MKQSVARRHIMLAVAGIQKYRSNLFECGYTETFLATLHPYLFGEKCILSLLCRILDEDSMAPHDYLNARVLVSSVARDAVVLTWHAELFEPVDFSIMVGWEDEDCDQRDGQRDGVVEWLYQEMRESGELP